MSALSNLKPNPDIVKERTNATCDAEKLKNFVGKIVFGSVDRYNQIKEISLLNL